MAGLEGILVVCSLLDAWLPVLALLKIAVKPLLAEAVWAFLAATAMEAGANLWGALCRAPEHAATMQACRMTTKHEAGRGAVGLDPEGDSPKSGVKANGRTKHPVVLTVLVRLATVACQAVDALMTKTRSTHFPYEALEKRTGGKVCPLEELAAANGYVYLFVAFGM